MKIITTGITSIRIMDPKLECLDPNCSADDVTKYIDWFNFWIDTRGTSDEKAINGAFLLEGNAKETVCAVVFQEKHKVGDNAENVDADIQREPIRIMP